MRRRAALVGVLSCAVVLVAACGSPTPEGATQPRGAALPGDFSGTGPGTLVSAETLPVLDPALRDLTSVAARITYLSTSGINDGHPRVSGTVFVPKGDPPPGGWNIVALGHPDTGSQSECAPSASPTLLGSAATVADLVGAGLVVTMTDYQGLGIDDVMHPFLDSTTEGYDLIDSVHAARKLVATASPSWVADGVGQGGQAAWAADELTADYHGDLKLAGAVAVTPTAALDGLASAAATDSLSRDQELTLQQFLASLAKEHDDVDLDAYRRGVVKDDWDALSACWGPAVGGRAQIADRIGPGDLRPDGADATQVLRGYLQKTSLPQAPTAAPMVIVPDTPDGLIPQADTEAAVVRACRMGDVVAAEPPGSGDEAAVLGWISDFFNGVPARNDCLALDPPSQPNND